MGHPTGLKGLEASRIVFRLKEKELPLQFNALECVWHPAIFAGLSAEFDSANTPRREISNAP